MTAALELSVTIMTLLAWIVLDGSSVTAVTLVGLAMKIANVITEIRELGYDTLVGLRNAHSDGKHGLTKARTWCIAMKTQINEEPRSESTPVEPSHHQRYQMGAHSRQLSTHHDLLLELTAPSSPSPSGQFTPTPTTSVLPSPLFEFFSESVEADAPAPDSPDTDHHQGSSEARMTDKLLKAMRGLFPSPVEKGLPGLFDGHDATTYLERFSKTYRITGGGDDDQDKISYFEQWCDDDLKEIIDDWPADKRASWSAFEATVKARWQWNDSRRDDSTKEFDRVIETRCNGTAEDIYRHLERIEVLMTRVPIKKKVGAKANAPGKVWERFTGAFQAGCRPYERNDEPIEDMDWETFRDFIQKCLRKGINAGSLHYKIDPKVKVTSTTRETTPEPTPVVTIPESKPVKPVKLTPSAQMEAKHDYSIDDLAGALEHLRIVKIQAGEKIARQIESFRQIGHQMTDSEAESLRTNLLNVNPDSEDETAQTYFVKGDRGNRSYVSTGSRNAMRSTKRIVTPRACYYCNDPDHYIVGCPTYCKDMISGLFHRNGFDYVMGREHTDRGSYPFVVIPKGDIDEAQDRGDVIHLIRAYASVRPDMECWPRYQEWCEEFKKETGREYKADVNLIKDPHFHHFPKGRPGEVRTTVNRVATISGDQERSVFNYTRSKALNIWHRPNEGGRTMVQKLTSKPDWQIRDEEQQDRYDAEEDVSDEDEEDVAATMAQGAPPAKRMWIEEEEPDEPGMTGTTDGDRKVEENRRIILRPPQASQPSAQITPQSVPAKKLVKKEVSFVEPVTGDSEAYLRDLILKSLQSKSQLTVDDLIRISPGYKEAMIAYISAAKTTFEVIDYKGSSIPGKDTNQMAPKEGEGLPRALRTNVNGVMGVPSGAQTEETVPAIFGITNDGLWAVARKGFWNDLIHNGSRTPPTEQAIALMKTPCDQLNFSQKVELGVLTRTHALPTLYGHFESIYSNKVLALIDSGSECNVISAALAQEHGLAIQDTTVISKGLHQSRAFLGETQGKFILAGQSINCHFFVMDGSAGGYDILLGMPFLKETNLTFTYNEGRLVSANVAFGEKLVRAHVVSDAISKIRPPN